MEDKIMSTINFNDKSKVKNLCDWAVSWERETLSGDEYIKANAIVYINNAEIETQVRNGNKFLVGNDNLGSHAKIYIENPEFREYLGFDNKAESRTQFILDEEKCKQILEYKTFSVFKKHIEDNITTNHEKAKIMNYARKIKINDFDKIQFLESFTNMTFNNK
jgi:hypothetical protein